MKTENKEKKKDLLLANIINTIEGLYKKFNLQTPEEENENYEFVQNIADAREEWKTAEKFFHTVSDPDLVDHAIYKLEAAKTRYIYLLKKAKEEGIKVNFH